MKKLVAIALSMILLFAFPIFVMAEESLLWKGMHVEVVSLEESKFLQPGDMKSTEYPVMLKIETDEALWKNEALQKEMYRASSLIDREGNCYLPSASAVGNDKPSFIYLFGIPKEIDLSDLSFVLEGAEAENAEAAEKAEDEAEDKEETGEAAEPEETEEKEEEEDKDSEQSGDEQRSSHKKLTASDKKNTVWSRDKFKELLDCSFRDFKPEKSKANAFFFILAEESQSFPKTVYAEKRNEEEEAHLLKAIRSLKEKLSKDPAFENAVFVDDPDQASFFLELNFQYIYNTRYYEGKKSFEGYDCELTLRALHAGSKIEIAEISGKNKLPLEVDVGDTPDGGDFCADPPGPENMKELPLLTEALAKLNELKELREEVLKTKWADDNKEELLASLLSYYSAFSDGPWGQAICEAGAEELSLSKNALEFFLRAFDPKLEEIAMDQAAEDWMLQAVDNASAYDLKITLPLKDSKLSRESLKSLEEELKRAAADAEAAFASEDFCYELCRWLYPYSDSEPGSTNEGLWEELAGSLEAAGSPRANLELDDIAPFFQSQRELSLDVSEGPHALRFSGTGANPEKMLQKAKDKCYAYFTSFPKNQVMDYDPEDELRERLDELAKTVGEIIPAEDGETDEDIWWENYTFSLDLDKLDSLPEAYLTYLNRYDYKSYAEPLLKAVYDWQHMPALPFPGSGWLSGSQSGTLLNIYAPSDGLGRYLQIRQSWDDSIALTAFLNSGHMISVYVPAGSYYLQIAAGETWYGYEELFGDQGGYGRSDVFQVLDSNHYHDIKLKTSQGNLGSQATSKDAFKP